MRPQFIHNYIDARSQPGADVPHPRVGGIAWHDATVAVWEEGVDEENMRREVMGPMITEMRRLGVKVGPDADIVKNYNCLKKSRLYCRMGDLDAKIKLSGRYMEVSFFQRDSEHGFDKLEKMHPLLRRRCIVVMAAIAKFLRSRHGYTTKQYEFKHADLGRPGITALQQIEAEYAASWHTKKELGRPDWEQDYNRKSADGDLLDQGMDVWVRDEYGKRGWMRGRAHYHINSMWWVVTGPYDRQNLSCGQIHTRMPVDVHSRKASERKRRERLEGQLSEAMRKMDFQRAALIRRILFGDDPLFRIWSDKKDAWYAPLSMGYTNDTLRAGLYTREEAECAKGMIDFLKIIPASGSHAPKGVG